MNTLLLTRRYGTPSSDWNKKAEPVYLVLIESEILVLWARSEKIGSAIGKVRLRFQVSGFRCQQKSKP